MINSKRKQDERASRLATLPKPYLLPLYPAERAILSAPIDQLVQDVHKQVTSPVDVLRAYGKAAIKAHETTNCLTEVMIPQAEEWATNGSINLKGPLAGIPVSLKDSIVVGGFDTSVGYSTKTGKPWPIDGVMVKMLKDAGAIPFVKTALPISLLSFESTNDVWGRCTNPHNKDYSPGGSTGGEGALLAFGGSRIGIGSDVAGSVRAPAHFSGIYSLRCSTGRWPKAGMDTSMPGQEGIPSVFSPMARTLTDLTYFTRSFIGMKPWLYDPTVHPIPWRDSVEKSYNDKKRLRIGVLRTDGVIDPSPACARALQTTVSALEAQGHKVFDLTPPPAPYSPYDALVNASQLLAADGCSTFLRFFRTGEWNDPGAAQMTVYASLPRPIRYLYYLYVRYIRRDPVWAGLLENFGPKTANENWLLVAKREAIKAVWFEWWNTINKTPSSSSSKRSATGLATPGAGTEGTTDGDIGAGEMDAFLTVPNATPAVPHEGMKDAVSSCGYTFLFNLLDYTAGIIPVTKVDPTIDALPSTFSLGKLNGVAQGAYMHYDAVRMKGLPVGVQVIGRRLEEEKVLAIMARCVDALEKAGKGYQHLEMS